MIYQSGSGRSRLPGANCFLLKKGCRQASPVRGGSQRQTQAAHSTPMEAMLFLDTLQRQIKENTV